jgi:hypothetical protein
MQANKLSFADLLKIVDNIEHYHIPNVSFPIFQPLVFGEIS